MACRVEGILKKLVIIAGQWKMSAGNKAELESQFSTTLDQAESLTGKSRESVIDMLLVYIEKGTVTA